MKRILSIIIAVVLSVAFVFTGCEKKEATNKKQSAAKEKTVQTLELKEIKGIDDVIAEVEGTKFTQADFNFFYKNFYDNYSSRYGENWMNEIANEEGVTVGEYIKELSMEQLVQLVAGKKLAEKYSISLEEGFYDEYRKSLVENFGGEEAFKAFLDESRTTENAVKRYLEGIEILNMVYSNLMAEDSEAYMSEAELKKEFGEKYMRVQHILISTKSTTDAEGNEIPGKTDEEAQKIADEVLSKIENGEDFSSLIETYDEDPGMEKDGYYTFTEGEMVPEFEEAAKALSVGEYTKEAVKTSYGYHIIKKYEVDTDCEEYSSFSQQRIGEKAMEIINNKVEALDVKKVDDAVLEKYINEWVAELNQALKAELEAQKAAEAQENDSQNAENVQ